MVYVVTRAVPHNYQMSLEDLWFGDDDKVRSYISKRPTSTVTRCTDNAPPCNQYKMLRSLEMFVATYRSLIQADKRSLYHTFFIPKSSGGLRRIDAPLDDLMSALRSLKTLFETEFGADWLYHTSAFAYIHNRSTIDCVKKHQSNNSKWFGKYDLHNFFGSTTLDYVMKMLSMIHPFSTIACSVLGNALLRETLSLCFLDGVLPQGTPMSPMLTNIMMIPVDYILERKFREMGLVYSRYADDFLISSRHQFSFREVEGVIRDVLASFEAPFELNAQKTRYGSASGANWNFGVILNKDNNITIGRKRKKQFESMLAAYAKDKRRHIDWSIDDVRRLDGLRSYYKMVEGETIDRIVDHISEKHGVNIRNEIANDLRK